MTSFLRIMIVLFLGISLIFTASPSGSAQTQAESQVRQDLELTLDLWRSGRYEEVYHRVMESGGHTKEYFVNHLAAAPRKPACCWEKIQEVKVTVKGESKATLKAKLGFDTGTGVEFMTRSVTLEQEDGIWKVKMSDLLALSGTSKKVRGKK